jgi:uncharacterized cupredoxin-like copper-binding protein
MVRIGRMSLVLAAAAVVLSACSGATSRSGTADSPRVVDLTMTDEMTFEPARIQVRRGETVAFRVRNVSNEGHEAYIGTEEEQRLHERDHSGFGGDQDAVTHMGYGIHIAPFGTGELVSTFDEDVEYVIGCHYPGHYAAGMRAVIDVSE